MNPLGQLKCRSNSGSRGSSKGSHSNRPKSMKGGHSSNSALSSTITNLLEAPFSTAYNSSSSHARMSSSSNSIREVCMTTRRSSSRQHNMLSSGLRHNSRSSYSRTKACLVPPSRIVSSSSNTTCQHRHEAIN